LPHRSPVKKSAMSSGGNYSISFSNSIRDLSPLCTLTLIVFGIAFVPFLF
jgi:hypothetical protein